MTDAKIKSSLIVEGTRSGTKPKGVFLPRVKNVVSQKSVQNLHWTSKRAGQLKFRMPEREPGLARSKRSGLFMGEGAMKRHRI